MMWLFSRHPDGHHLRVGDGFQCMKVSFSDLYEVPGTADHPFLPHSQCRLSPEEEEIFLHGVMFVYGGRLSRTHQSDGNLRDGSFRFRPVQEHPLFTRSV